METLIIQFTGYIYLLLALCFAIIFIMMKYSATEKDDYIDLSKYDVEVDARLNALEEKVNSPSGEIVGSSDERITALEKKLDDLIYKLSTKMTL